jgi:CubicO group peptidase (beta-lactamase class C family)
VIHVALVDDQAIIRAGLARILSPADGFEVVAECADGRQAVKELPQLHPDVVLIDATWSLDSEASGFEKMESGLNVAPVDYARFGELLLHRGEWNGARIVSERWVRAATGPDASTDPFANYQYFWWVDVARPGRFYALGNLGQYIYVAPDAGTVIVRNGRDWGVDNDTWVSVMRDLADQLVVRS